MGYYFVTSACFLCGRLITYNPNLVPSLRDAAGERQPVCGPCVKGANEQRKAAGVTPWPDPLPGAYEAASEDDI